MTTTSKRSRHINLARMRKSFPVKPLALGVTTVLLSGCGNQQDATVYQNPQECSDANPGHEQQCQAAYQQAMQDAERTAPKYNTLRDCEYEFGANQCHSSGSGSFFMPFMAGYMLSNLLSPGHYYSQPLFTSYSPYSTYRGHWLGAGGRDYGTVGRRHFRVNKSAFEPKPTVSRTIKRGGFGSSVRAKSSWGSSRSWGGRSGWGG